MNVAFEVLERLRAERAALLREREELLTCGSAWMRAVRTARSIPRDRPVARWASPAPDAAPAGIHGGAAATSPDGRAATETGAASGDARRAPSMQGPAGLA
jgi:hypothetical protein